MQAKYCHTFQCGGVVLVVLLAHQKSKSDILLSLVKLERNVSKYSIMDRHELLKCSGTSLARTRGDQASFFLVTRSF